MESPKDSKSKRDTKNSNLVSISGNMAEKFSDSLCSSENHFGLYFQKTRPEIYYCQHSKSVRFLKGGLFVYVMC